MRPLAVFAFLILVAAPAKAAEVPITCSISAGTMFRPNGNITAHKMDESLNFTITPRGLKTSWGEPCDLMRGAVTKALVEVACDQPLEGGSIVRRIVTIDRAMSTVEVLYSIEGGDLGELAEGTVTAKEQGTCVKREGF